MYTSTSDRFILVEAFGGVRTRTAKDLEELIEELLTNSGPDIAMKGVEIARRAERKWIVRDTIENEHTRIRAEILQSLKDENDEEED